MKWFKKLFNDTNPTYWHDPHNNRPTIQSIPQKQEAPETLEEDRDSAHRFIDTIFSKQPQLAERAHLMTDIAAELMPWMYNEKEVEPVMTGLRFMQTPKMIELKQTLQNKETPYKRKALIKRTLLFQGYIHHRYQQMNKQLVILPLLILGTLASAGGFLYGITKHNDRAVHASGIAFVAGYYLASKNKEKYEASIKDAVDFEKNLKRHPEEMTKMNEEHQKWFIIPKENEK